LQAFYAGGLIGKEVPMKRLLWVVAPLLLVLSAGVAAA